MFDTILAALHLRYVFVLAARCISCLVSKHSHVTLASKFDQPKPVLISMANILPAQDMAQLAEAQVLLPSHLFISSQKKTISSFIWTNFYSGVQQKILIFLVTFHRFD